MVSKPLAFSALGLAALLATHWSGDIERAPLAPSASSALIETETVQPPRAYRRLCNQEPGMCDAERAAQILAPYEARLTGMFGEDALKIEPVVLTEARMRQLEQVNDAVNVTIVPQPDMGGDVWSLGALVGDCEEYVLMKRELLMRLGWPRSALRITVVHDGAGYHAVLVVNTDRGDFVLDNLVAYVSRAENSPYEFVVAESRERPGSWVRISRARGADALF